MEYVVNLIVEVGEIKFRIFFSYWEYIIDMVKIW